MENWRRYLKEALEFSSQKSGGPMDDFYIPPHLKKLADEVKELDIKVQQAYESGSPEAEELDAQFASRQEELESAMSELGAQGELKTGSEESKYDYSKSGDPATGRDLNLLMHNFARIYNDFIKGRTSSYGWYGDPIKTKQELADWLRRHARWFPGSGPMRPSFEESTSDEDLIDAAKDSYERRIKLTTPTKSYLSRKEEKRKELVDLMKTDKSSIDWIKNYPDAWARMSLDGIEEWIQDYKAKT